LGLRPTRLENIHEKAVIAMYICFLTDFTKSYN